MSSYLDHLPAVFRTDRLGRFLLAFEDVLHGARDAEHPPLRRPGLAELLADLSPYLYPDDRTPEEDFLPWLAGWVALSLRADWDRATKVRFVQESVPLYRRRGTLAGLRRMLEIHLGRGVEIDDGFERIPHYFQVRLVLADPSQPLTEDIATAMRSSQETARAIIDQEKPAHTFYALKLVVPTMRLVTAEPLILGRNTLLGTAPYAQERQP